MKGVLTDLGTIRGRDVPPTAHEFLEALEGPVVFRVEGRDRSRARAVAGMLHGNEPSGFRALHAWLRSDSVPEVDIVAFIGAVEAARLEPRFSHRHLPGRRDMNRCFRPPYEDREGVVASEALDFLRGAQPEALIDLHNNTGHNPAYGVGIGRDPGKLGLTSLFASRYVHSSLRLGALMEAFGEDFPIVTIECGRAGDPKADEVALEGLRSYASLVELPLKGPSTPQGSVKVLSDPIPVRARRGLCVGFAERPGGADLVLTQDVDRHNFSLVAENTPIGWVSPSIDWPVEARTWDDREVSREFFRIEDGRLMTRVPMMPIMMTTNPVVALSDCLFYVVRDG